jgi:hypothetical protein
MRGKRIADLVKQNYEEETYFIVATFILTDACDRKSRQQPDSFRTSGPLGTPHLSTAELSTSPNALFVQPRSVF